MKSAPIFVVGCSDGIGLSVVERLLRSSYRVVGISRRDSPLCHERYRHLTVDVADARYGACLDQLLREEGPPSALYYCAAIAERPQVTELDRDVRVFEVNLLAAVVTAEHVLGAMQTNGGGRFIVLSSQADQIISPEAPSYTASKAALSAYFSGLGLKLKRTGLHITVVRFGFVATKLARQGWQPFVISREQAAARLEALLSGRPRLLVTYPRRVAILAAVVARAMSLRVRLS